MTSKSTVSIGKLRNAAQYSKIQITNEGRILSNKYFQYKDNNLRIYLEFRVNVGHTLVISVWRHQTHLHTKVKF